MTAVVVTVVVLVAPVMTSMAVLEALVVPSVAVMAAAEAGVEADADLGTAVRRGHGQESGGRQQRCGEIAKTGHGRAPPVPL